MEYGGQIYASMTGSLMTRSGTTCKPGFIHYVSPSQINVQAPADGTEGTVAVTVTSSAGTSDPVAAPERPSFPAFFASDNFVAAVHVDGTVITGTGSARAGETISLYGTGFGATNPAIAPGLVGAFEARLTSTVEITIGGVPAPLTFAGLSAAGLDQFNITVPSLPSGVYEVIATLGGQRTKSGVYLPVRNTR